MTARVVVASALMSLAGTGARAGQNDSDGMLHLAWVDPEHTAGLATTMARAETVRVFDGIGIPVRWREIRPGDPARDGEVRVILLDRRATGPALVLGAAPSHAEAQPFVWIHVPAVRDGIGLGSRPLRMIEGGELTALGIALGRVIAHEVVHAIAPEVAHGKGLMAPQLTVRDLTARRLEVRPDVARAVHAAVAAEADLGRRTAAATGGLMTVQR